MPAKPAAVAKSKTPQALKTPGRAESGPIVSSAHLVSARQDLVTVEVTIPASAMKAWALKHAPLVKVTAPSYLVKEVKEAADGLCRLYGAP